ncbi:PP2C family protein-serine/threonine phosphatase [Amycolatopsis sp. NPDC051372]|uniref:PP2C family protein-serine/threonine phosphatase n=1 Tax=Amycolatopsis sp. NPDC051372 TaxID=3155669 RepID=UPI00341FC7E4
MSAPDRDGQQREILLAYRHADLTAEQLWTRYFALRGSHDLVAVEAYLDGVAELPPHQCDLLAQAVNERLDEVSWTRRAPYSRTLRPSRPRDDSLAALVHLLEGTELAPPERLAHLVEEAGRLIGVGFSPYLVDYAQQYLHPLSAAGDPGPPLPIDSTLAGRAFRSLEVLPADSAGSPCLWVPLVDGVERIGVLRADVADEDTLQDPGLRAQCRWTALLIGHLVVLMTQYGDGLDAVRRRRDRTVPGELIWSLLPPLTAGVDGFVVTGVLEPRHAVAGDAFDYSLSDTTALLFIVDAVGHDLRSGHIAATALATHRSARRAGYGLFEQARQIDETIAAAFGNAIFATAVFVEVDLATGRMRYINAGHPEPLLMRGGRVVKRLIGGRRAALGLGSGELVVGEEQLQPDDWLVLYTDGITEARNSEGEFFGEARLADFLRREASAGYPPPETVRRLIQAVLTHHDGSLQDDATVLLARWTDPRNLIPKG